MSTVDPSIGPNESVIGTVPGSDYMLVRDRDSGAVRAIESKGPEQGHLEPASVGVASVSKRHGRRQRLGKSDLRRWYPGEPQATSDARDGTRRRSNTDSPVKVHFVMSQRLLDLVEQMACEYEISDDAVLLKAIGLLLMARDAREAGKSMAIIQGDSIEEEIEGV